MNEANAVLHEQDAASAVTEIGPDRYRFHQRALLHAPLEAVSSTIDDFAQFLKIVLPHARDFQWLEGGGPGRVPSRYQFVIGDATLLEEVSYVSGASTELHYRLVRPALGMREYHASIGIEAKGTETTVIEYVRDITMEPGVSVDGLRSAITEEIIYLARHFDTPRSERK